MGPVFYVMAIMGCGDGATMCEQVARGDDVYRSEAACYAQSEQALIRASGEPYPLILAECQQVSRQVAERMESRRGWFTAS
jgi:hypothetical protein